MQKHTLCAGLAVLALFSASAKAAGPASLSAAPVLAAVSADAVLSEETRGLGVSQSTSRVAVDSFLVAPEGYCINQENYYKLRDLALLLTGKNTAFDVVWDDEHQCISMLSGRDYTVAGGEMSPAGDVEIYKFVPSYSEVRLDGQVVQMTGYNINNNNYYRIRDVGPIIGFGVDWDNDTATVVIDSRTDMDLPPLTVQPEASEEGADGFTDGSVLSPEDVGASGGAEEQIPEEPVEPVYPWIGPKIDGVLTILLDPGHGGTDPGSFHPETNQNENTTNLAVANYLKEMLEADGVRVIMSRTSTSETLKGSERKEYVRRICEQGELDLVLSIHHNGSTAHSAHGSEVYVQSAGLSPEAGTEGKADPSIVSNALGVRLLRSYMSMGNGLISRGVKESSTLYMVYTSGEYGIPAVLSEFCFIDHADDVKLIDSPQDLQAEAAAIYDALMDFYAGVPY